jgi:hypothetical protein
MRHGEKAKVGVFGIGLAAYWPQFSGLKERLEGYQRKVERRLGEWATVISGGLVDDAPKAEEAAQAFLCAGVDLVFCYVGTYATSSQVLPVVQQSKAPVVVLNLQPRAALDYPHTDTGEWLANCSACCVPEISGAFARSAIPFRQVTGMLEPEPDVREPSELAWSEIQEWCEAAKVIRNLRKARMGFLGHPYPGMLDMYSDFTQHHAQLGTHVEVLEMCDLEARVRAVSEAEVQRKAQETRNIFEISEDSPSDPLGQEARAGGDGLGLPGGGGSRSVGGGFQPGWSDLLLSRRGREPLRTAGGQPDPGMFPFDGAWNSVFGRSRFEKLPGHEDHGPAGCGRQLYRTLRHGFSRTLYSHGPRRTIPPGHCRGPAGFAGAGVISRQERPWR